MKIFFTYMLYLVFYEILQRFGSSISVSCGDGHFVQTSENLNQNQNQREPLCPAEDGETEALDVERRRELSIARAMFSREIYIYIHDIIPSLLPRFTLLCTYFRFFSTDVIVVF